MNRKVSIIIPVLNREKELPRSLESVARQDWRPLEVVVVDNGSTDGSARKAEEFRKIFDEKGIEYRMVYHPERGASKARNRGLREATGEMIVFLDSDDTMRRDLIGKAMRSVEGGSDVVVCWKCCQHFQDGKKRVSPVDISRPLENHLVHTLVHPLGCMASTSIWRRSGGWNENLMEWDDLELGVRVLLENPDMILIPEVLGDVWLSGDSITGSDFSSRAGRWEMALDIISKEIAESDYPGKERMLRLAIYRKIILAAMYSREKQYRLATSLLTESVRSELLNSWQQLLGKLAYHYTRVGGRGAWRLIRRWF